MKNTEEIFELLKTKFGEDNISLISEEPSEDVVLVSTSKLKDIALFLKDESELKFDSLVLLSGVDDNNGTTVKDEEGNSTIEGHTLSVYYHLESLELKQKLILKVSVPIETPEIESVESVWKVADWHEREAFDLFGIKFLNHPNLIRILLPYDWEGYPLRKDYKNPEFYQGMKIPYE